MDLHCHLDLYPDPVSVAKECSERGLYVLSVTTTPSAWRGTSALARGHIRTALGLHPELAHVRKTEIGLFDDILSEARFIGEVGLDGSPEFRPYWKDQLTVFEHITAICAQAGGRIMSIHSRHASKAVLDCLEANPKAGTPILHWFSGNLRDLSRAIALGCWFSVGPVMLSSVRGKALVALMPKCRVLPESDGPFTQHKGALMLPWHTELIHDELSGLWGIEAKQIEHQLTRNLAELVGGHGF